MHIGSVNTNQVQPSPEGVKQASSNSRVSNHDQDTKVSGHDNETGHDKVPATKSVDPNKGAMINTLA